MRISPMIRHRARHPLAGLALLTVLTVSACSDDSPSGPGGDQTAPRASSSLEFQTPAQGAMLAEGSMDSSMVEVTGTACDSTTAVTGVQIDGVEQLLTGAAPCFDFSTTVQSRWGLNTIDATVSTANGSSSNFVRSFLRSPGYFAPPPPPKGMSRAEPIVVPSAVVIRMTQDLIDDGERGTSGNPDADDLATLLQLAVRSRDLAASLGSTLLEAPSTRTCNCLWPLQDLTINRNGAAATAGTLEWTPVRILSVTLVPGGFDLRLDVRDLALPLTVTGYLGDCITSCVDRINHRVTVAGDMYLDKAEATARVYVGLDSGGNPDVTMGNVAVSLTGLTFDVDWGVLDFIDGIANAVANSIVDNFEHGIEGLVARVIQEEAPGVTRAFLDAYRLPSTVSLDVPNNTSVLLGTRFDDIEFTPSQVVLSLEASVMPVQAPEGLIRGSIERGGDLPELGSSPGNLATGVKDDFLNQFLYAAWAGGALNIASLGGFDCVLPEGTTLAMSTTLPPVVMPGSGAYPMDVGLGDVIVTGTMTDEAAARFGATTGGNLEIIAAATAGAELQVDSGGYRFAIDLAGDYALSFSIVQAPEGIDLGMLAAEYEITLRCIAEDILARLFEAYPLPSVNLGLAGIDGLPPQAAWQMANPLLERQSAYIAVSGNAELR